LTHDLISKSKPLLSSKGPTEIIFPFLDD